MSRNIVFLEVSLLKDKTGIAESLDSKAIKPIIKVAQDTKIMPTLGTNLYNRLQDGTAANNLTTNEKLLLNDYVTDTLVWYTMAMLPLPLAYQYYNKGVLQKTAAESNAPSKNDLESVGQHYTNIAEFYRQRLINYLKDNYNLFQAYVDYGTGWGAVKPLKASYNCGIYLGGEEVTPISGGTYSGGQAVSGGGVATFVSIGGETTFEVPLLFGKIPLLAFRSGFVKMITTAATTDTNKLQINNTTVTLPIGDIAQVGEIFIIQYQ